MAKSALNAATVGEEAVPASQYREARELHLLLGRKSMENELLREAVSRAAGAKNCCCARSRSRGMEAERGRRGGRHRSPPLVRSAPSPSTSPTRTTIGAEDGLTADIRLSDWFADCDEVHPHRALRY
jgi:hypothetical protein